MSAAGRTIRTALSRCWRAEGAITQTASVLQLCTSRDGQPAAFPDLSPTELSQALQVAQAQAERKALRPH
jgi:hypothetical protein